MELVYAFEEPVNAFAKGVFLAGPSPRSSETPSWRPEAVRALAEAGFDGNVFIPEPRDGKWPTDYDAQIEWEVSHLDTASIIAFWIPRELKDMPGFTTNVEFGMYVGCHADSPNAEYFAQHIILGYPHWAEKVRYLRWHADRHNVPVVHTLEDVAAKVMELTK